MSSKVSQMSIAISFTNVVLIWAVVREDSKEHASVLPSCVCPDDVAVVHRRGNEVIAGVEKEGYVADYKDGCNECNTIELKVR
jgi:hypothetical protein